jgi:adenine-specific DNA-methyltransferase
MPRGKRRTPAAPPRPENYQHADATQLLKPEVGTQPLFQKKKEPATYRYDSSLSPALDWDNNPAREQGEALLRQMRDAKTLDEAKAAAAQLAALSRPFLNWTGKAERLSFDVPTLPLFVHERLSTRAILETLKAHRRDKQDDFLTGLFGNPSLPVNDQVLRAYEHREPWQNRMILGDSLVVMNSLLRFENLGGQVQMIYLDPPYGVKFGSNFQPFVRKRDVTHGDDADLTREPEMVQAYRDTWELGLHSYLTYLRDRFLLAKELLAPSGSIFVQISDENLHHVRELLDEVFGAENSVVTIVFKKKSATTPTDPVHDYLLWYAKDRSLLKTRQLFLKRRNPEDDPKFNTLVSPAWEMKRVKDLEEGEAELLLSKGWKWARVNYPLVSQDENERSRDFVWNGKSFSCGRNRHWTFDPDAGMNRLATANRLFDGGGESLGGVVFWDDWPFVRLSTLWDDIHGEPDPIYVVQTTYKVLQRCILMTTDPGDLVVDPTCGSGTTAYVAEQWGRRWITIDTSRVPLALARQRLLTATFDYYEINPGRASAVAQISKSAVSPTSKSADLMNAGEPSNASAGLETRDTAGLETGATLPNNPALGFVYRRKQNAKGEEIGGIVPHVTLKSIANNEPPQEEVLVDRPEIKPGIVRVTGPFTVEATIPTPVDFEGDGIEDSGAGAAEEHGHFVSRMIEILRRNPVLRLGGNRSVSLKQVRPPVRTLCLHAEALVERLSVVSSQLSEGGADEKGFSGTGGLAKGHGVGDGGLPGKPGLSQGGDVRPDQPASAGGGVHSQQHRRGASASESRGVSAGFGVREGVAGRTGDTGAGGAESGLSGSAGGQPASGTTGGGGASAQRSDSFAAGPTTDNRQLTTSPVAFVFGPENGAVSGKLVENAAIEARRKDYTHLYVIGFAIEAGARKTVEESEAAFGIPATYVQATPDILMGDLLKTMRSSQIFSVCGLPEIRVSRKAAKAQSGEDLYEVELLGLDVFDPVEMKSEHRSGMDVPAWFLDTDYNGTVFRVCQAFFPRTGAWENLKRELRAEFEESVWAHLAGTTSAPFPAGPNKTIAVKVIDDRGNELLVTKAL